MRLRHSLKNFALAAALVCCASSAAAAAGGKKGAGRASDSGASRFVKLDGARVHYKSAGKGREALVFVHGWTCNLEFWRMQVPAFAARGRVIAIDLPGHGQSDKPEGVSYSMDRFARAIDAVLRDAGVRRAVLVGHSMGVPVIRQFYRHHPEKTRALVLVDGALRPFAPRAAMEQFLAPMRANYGEAAGRMVEGLVGPVKSEAVREEIRKAMLSTPRHVGLSAMDGMVDESIWKEDRITVPVLTILARSPFWAPDTEAFFRRVAPDHEFQMWEGVSHFLMMDEPDRFNRTLSAFLDARGLSGRPPKK